MKAILLRAGFTGASIVLMSTAYASGYKVNEQSASGVGTAYAGRAAVADDASVVFYNPAAMSKLKRSELSFGATYIDVKGSFEGTRTNPAGVPDAAEGNAYDDGGDFVPNATIPFVYYVHPVDDKVAFGFGIFAPFGTHTDYSSNALVGGFADETELTTIDFQPTFSYRVSDTLAIGGGIDIMYAHGLLSKQLDLVPYVPGHPQLGNTDYQGYENNFEVEGNDLGYGWNLGLIWDVTARTTLGFTYRSEVDLELVGDSKFIQSSGVVAYTDPDGDAGPYPAGIYPVDGATGQVDSQASRVPLTTPRSATLSLAHQATDNLQLQAGATWTDWSVFKYFDIIATKPGLIDDLSGLGDNYIGHIVEKWHDTLSWAVGASYRIDQRWLLRGGYAYDEAPVSDDHRTARVPDTDRQWLTAGARYDLNNDISFDLGIAYLLIDDSKLNEYDYDLNDQVSGVENAQGTYDVDALGVSLQMNYRM
ncbi:OmpP1/FadL family transporter [Thalassolituus sp.]|uniref:OmpP1/FadL family transporter n=1 Tax=Thalassolituus sp. TaxID=2030822 RepID=UPI002A7F3F22|nr:outer membrane protein transport protein [Thalassolituus sp.]